MRRSGFWFWAMCTAVVILGLSGAQYWSGYDNECGFGYDNVWVWSIPPTFECQPKLR